MKARHTLHVASLALALSFIFHPSAFAQTTAFTYQGRLDTSGASANGIYDFTFAVHDDPLENVQVGALLTNSAVLVSNGLFTTLLDFGPGVFTGGPRWLEIGVRSNGVGDFAVLVPRQAIAATPHAILSGSAGALWNQPDERQPGLAAPRTAARTQSFLLAARHSRYGCGQPAPP